MANSPYNNIDSSVYSGTLNGERDDAMGNGGNGAGPDGEGNENSAVETEESPEQEFSDVEEGQEPEFGDNLAEFLDDAVLFKIIDALDSDIEDDDMSREEWKDQYEKGMVLLGMEYEERTEPFDGATGVTHPILNEAVTQFQAQAYKELLPAGGPVRTSIIGKVTPEKEAQANRVKMYMNYQITQVMEEYDPDFDQMLFYVGYGGSAFKKVYYDSYLERGTSPYVLPKDLIVPYSARDLLTAERVTHVLRYSPNELRKLQLSGFYRDVHLGKPVTGETDIIQERMDRIRGVEEPADVNEYTLHECHCYLDIEGYEDKDENGEETGLQLPYIVTYESKSQVVLSIRRNYREDDPKKLKKQYFVHYKFLPGMGFYGFGLVHLLGNLSRTSTAILRQLIDAGTLSNLPAGFKAKGLRMEDQTPIQPGEWRDVDVPGGDIASSLLPLPYKEPSATLFQLLGFCIDAAQKFIGTTDLGMGDSNNEMPVGTTIAMLERGSRVMSAVHKRLHNAQMQELKLLADIFAEYLPPEYPYEVTGADASIKAADFDGKVDILPVSDPNIFSMTQRITLAQQQLQMAQQAPQMHNMYEAYRRMYSALGVTDIDLVLPPPPQAMPESPALENARSLTIPSGGNPLKVFPDQDHLAHMQTHLTFIKLPLLQTSPAVYGVLLSHVLEHLSLAAQQQVVLQMQHQGINIQLQTHEMEVEVAKAEAQMMQGLMQQLSPPPAGPDPLIQLQQQGLQLKAQELQQRGQTDQAKLAIDAQKLQHKEEMDRQKVQSMEDIAQLRANTAMQRVKATQTR
jgi:hypothetical protein